MKREQVSSTTTTSSSKVLCIIQLRMMEEITRLSLTPLEVMMKRVLNKLSAKDPADIFAEPVPVDDVSVLLQYCSH